MLFLRHIRLAAAPVVGLLLLGAVSHADAQRVDAQQPRKVDDAALRNAGKSGEDWLTYGRDPGETRFSPLNQINASNVNRLGLLWSYDLGAGGGNQEATPLERNGVLYTITNWSVVVAVDVRTGKQLWKWDPEVNQSAVFPKICCGVVHRGLAMYQNLIIAPIIDGRLQALDADTGKVVWEARVAYPQDNYTVTMAPRIAKGKVIVGVSGSEYPVRGFFSAFDALTGHFAWKFYTVPGDSWDYDSVQQLLLADITVKGKPRKVIMQANKDGFYYVLDRATGQFISGQPFAQVTWARGLNEETGRPIINQAAHYGTDTITLSPGPGGAHNWAPMSFNPATGLVYIPTSAASTYDFTVDDKFVYKDGEKNLGVVRPGTQAATADTAGTAVANKPTTKLSSPPAIGPEAPPPGQRGLLMAWDPVTQKERWRAPGGGSIGGGTVTTAGNLVFQVIPDGRLMAYRADTGEKLLEIKTGLRGGMGPPITYQIDGKQYITLGGGTGRVTPSVGTPAPAAASGPGPALPKLLTFVLDGTGTLPQ